MRPPTRRSKLRPPTRPKQRVPVLRQDAPVQLRWDRKPNAGYYDFVLWRDGHRVLDLWPTAQTIVVPKRWDYRGHPGALTAGRYLWFVFPGIGARAGGRYGALIASGSFQVRAGAG